MKRLNIIFTVFLLISCNETKYSEQEKNQIEKEAYNILRQSESLIDSLKKVKEGIEVKTKYDKLYQLATQGSIEYIQSEKDSLYIALNEVEPNYEAIKERTTSWKYSPTVVRKRLNTAKAEADIAREAN